MLPLSPQFLKEQPLLHLNLKNLSWRQNATTAEPTSIYLPSSQKLTSKKGLLHFRNKWMRGCEAPWKWTYLGLGLCSQNCPWLLFLRLAANGKWLYMVREAWRIWLDAQMCYSILVCPRLWNWPNMFERMWRRATGCQVDFDALLLQPPFNLIESVHFKMQPHI